MKTNRIVPDFAPNQNSGIRICCACGIRNTPAITRKMTPNTGNVIRSKGRAGRAACEKHTTALAAKIREGRKLDPYSAGQSGCQPPRKSSVATKETVIMLAYSAMKNAAKLMLEYSVWNPA